MFIATPMFLLRPVSNQHIWECMATKTGASLKLFLTPHGVMEQLSWPPPDPSFPHPAGRKRLNSLQHWHILEAPLAHPLLES